MATQINDLVLVHVENKPTFYARVEDVSPDVKPGWWQVRLLALSIPVKILTWILEEDQINGKEFTMGGIPIRLERVVSPVGHHGDEGTGVEAPPSSEHGKVISLQDRKKT